MEIVAIALSGGKSSRMGRDKALLKINGETLLFRTCRTALQIADSVYVVARSQEQYQSAIADFSDRTFLVLDREFDGALVGFCQGLEAIAVAPDRALPDWILLLACDLPNIQTEALRIWAEDLANLPDNAIAYLPRYLDTTSQKQWEPLCGFYRWRVQDSLAKFTANGGRSFQRWLSKKQVIEILNVSSSMLLNCNTPEEFLDLE